MGKAPNHIRAAIIGSGNWATAFSKVLIDAGTDCRMFGVDTAVIEQIRQTRTHPNFPGVHISNRLKVSSDPAILTEAELVVLAIPAQVARSALESYGAFFAPGVKICSLIKGIEVSSLKPISEVVQEVTALAPTEIAVLSGPNLAGEIILRQPAAAVVASAALDTAYLVAKACDSGYYKPFVSRDVLGVELCGDLKNVVAICSGMCKALGMGYNLLASLITRGLKEISELGVKMGAQIETFQGLAGIGDLITTCFSPSSRNFSLGFNLASGKFDVDDALEASNGVAEGYYTARAARELCSRYAIQAPILSGVYRVLYQGENCREMLVDLLNQNIAIE